MQEFPDAGQTNTSRTGCRAAKQAGTDRAGGDEHAGSNTESARKHRVGRHRSHTDPCTRHARGTHNLHSPYVKALRRTRTEGSSYRAEQFVRRAAKGREQSVWLRTERVPARLPNTPEEAPYPNDRQAERNRTSNHKTGARNPAAERGDTLRPPCAVHAPYFKRVPIRPGGANATNASGHSD